MARNTRAPRSRVSPTQLAPLLQRIVVSDEELPLADAVMSYFFNSQIVKPSNRNQTSIWSALSVSLPSSLPTRRHSKDLYRTSDCRPANPIDDVHFVKLEESMANGGGPACLRTADDGQPENSLCFQTDLQLTPARFDALCAATRKTLPAKA